MGTRPLVLGVDVGTSSTRAIIFDAQGRPVAEGRASYPLDRPHPGWVEQQACWWWEAFCTATGDALTRAGRRAKEVAAVGITHQRITTVPVDEHLAPLRPAILWNDLRCTQEDEWAAHLLGTAHIYNRTGNYPSLWTVYKAMWLKRHEPEVYRRTSKFLLVLDYIIYHLTGTLLTTCSSAIQTGCLDVTRPTQWAEDILEALEIPVDKWVSPVRPGAEVAGRVHHEAAAATGLPEGMPVITAAGDQPCGVVGAGVAEEGILGINGGTSCSLEAQVDELRLDPAMNYFMEISPTGAYLMEDSIWSGGSALMNWFRNQFWKGDGGESSRTEDEWTQIYNLARTVRPGNDGLMLIPYYSGAASPYRDLRARGVTFGWRADHGQAHLVRAIMEGLAFESRRKKEFMEQGSEVPIREIRMYGGSARSTLWNQIFADITGVPVATLRTAETTALGAAMSAAVGVGLYPDFAAAVREMVHVDRTYVPGEDRRGLYQQLYRDVYSGFYDRVQDLIQTASRIMEAEDAHRAERGETS